MKLLIPALALGVLVAPAAQAAVCHHGNTACHRHYAAHHHYRHYAGTVVPPPGYYPPPGYPPPPYYSSFDQPLYGVGITIGEPYWGNRNTFKLLMQSIGDRPFND
ncbi:MAG TPA: hypothetical protein VKV77_03430 [Methylovirgula sp.]|nr:hypothetical protein [Methylovirgula sp.]